MNDNTTPDGGAPDGGASNSDNEPSIQQIQQDAANAKADAQALTAVSSGLVGLGTAPLGPLPGMLYTAYMTDQYSKFAAGVDAKVAAIAAERIADANIPPEYKEMANALAQEYQAQAQVDQDIAAGKGVPATDAASNAAAFEKFSNDMNNVIQSEMKQAQLTGQNASGNASTDSSSSSSSSSVSSDSGDGGDGGDGGGE